LIGLALLSYYEYVDEIDFLQVFCENTSARHLFRFSPFSVYLEPLSRCPDASRGDILRGLHVCFASLQSQFYPLSQRFSIERLGEAAYIRL